MSRPPRLAAGDCVLLATLALLTSAPVVAQKSPIAGARSEVYKRVDDVELRMHLLFPDEPESEQSGEQEPRPAIVFFFGGGWNGGRIEQFEPQARYFASRGMVAALADYRVRSRHKTTPFECVADGKSAVRWLRKHNERLGIDPNRLAAAGGSAGGHVAAATGVIDGLESDTVTKISSRPNALLLFNPVFDNGPGGYGHERLGKRWREISPLHHIGKHAPPTIVFLGTKDKLIPVSTGEAYRDAMKTAGCRCDLHLYEGQPHGFFNRQRNAKAYADTIVKSDRFLVELGWLHGEPAIATDAGK
ncbi:MAG: alpha/beta hydrolase [bacterium]|nr:alpha/beta hydrolase [bacterium]